MNWRLETPIAMVQLDSRNKPGLGVSKLIFVVPLFSEFFSALWKHALVIEYPIDIWQVFPQIGCRDTCQM